MLKKQRQKRHFQTEWQSMLACQEVFCRTRKPEALHRFRVQVKKIKALLHYLQGISTPGPVSTLQSLFKQAGRVRSAHISVQLMRQYQMTNEVLMAKLEQTGKDGAQQFQMQSGNSADTLQRLYKSLNSAFSDKSDKSVLQLCQKRLKRLARPDKIITNLHKARKQIKELLYFHDVLPKAIVRKLHLNTTYLRQLEETIGKWHDIISIIQLLESEEVADLNMIARLGRRRKRLFVSIHGLAGQFAGNAVYRALDD